MLSLFPPPSKAVLPPFSTLLVKGQHHPSAPLHLAIGHVLESPQHEVLIITSSRTKLQEKLISGMDKWLCQSGSTSKIRAAMSRIILLYPPTPAHFSLLVATLGGSSSVSELTRLWHGLAVLPTENLSMVILDEISGYLNIDTTNTTSPEHSLISLINRLIQCTVRVAANSDCPKTVSLACFEAALFDTHRTGDRPDKMNYSPRLQGIITSLFQWVCQFEILEDIPSSQEDENLNQGSKSHVRKLVRTWKRDGDERQPTIEYTEVSTPCVDSRLGVHFLWQ